MKRTIAQIAALLLTFVVGGAFLYFPIRDAQRAAIASSSQSRLNQLQLAMRNYHDVHGSFPPAYIAADDGTPVHSWRVLILPFVEGHTLVDEYDFDEPWNGPNNILLADRMPDIFHMFSEPESSRFTNIVAIAGAGTAFPGAATTSIDGFSDGLENTLLLTEISNSSICWLDPRDLTVEGLTRGPVPDGVLAMSAIEWRDPYVVFADRITAYAVRPNIPAKLLRSLATIAGGEDVTKQQMIEQGLLE